MQFPPVDVPKGSQYICTREIQSSTNEILVISLFKEGRIGFPHKRADTDVVFIWLFCVQFQQSHILLMAASHSAAAALLSSSSGDLKTFCRCPGQRKEKGQLYFHMDSGSWAAIQSIWLLSSGLSYLSTETGTSGKMSWSPLFSSVKGRDGARRRGGGGGGELSLVVTSWQLPSNSTNKHPQRVICSRWCSGGLGRRMWVRGKKRGRVEKFLGDSVFVFSAGTRVLGVKSCMWETWESLQKKSEDGGENGGKAEVVSLTMSYLGKRTICEIIRQDFVT